MSQVETPDGLIDLDEFEDATEEDMWMNWPTVAFWVWDNRRMVSSKPTRKPIQGDAEMYMCAYGGFWD